MSRRRCRRTRSTSTSRRADIYAAHRPSVAEPFGAPALVPELSSPRDDVNVRLSRDGTTMYLNYDTDANGGSDSSLDVATRACL